MERRAVNARIRRSRFAAFAVVSLACVGSVPGCSLFAPKDGDIFGDGGGGEVPSAARGGDAGTHTSGGRAGGGSGGVPATAGSEARAGSAGGSARGGESGAAGEQGGSAGQSDPSAGGESGAAGEPSSTAGNSGTAAGGSAGTGGEDPGDALVPRDELVLWLRADRGVMSTDGVVSEWIDQSAAALIATPPSGSASPNLLPTGLGERPAIEFDGEDDMLDLPYGFDDFTQGLSFFSVFEISGEEPPMYGDCPAILQLSNGRTGQSPATAHISFGRSGSSFSYSNHAAAPASGSLGASGLTRSTPHLISVVHAIGGASIYLDATTADTLSDMPVPEDVVRTYNHVGKSLFWFDVERSCLPFHGKIAEIILFRRPLESDERIGVERYLREKYTCCPD
jgi:hypothetical protein